jgi:hypothetical protein
MTLEQIKQLILDNFIFIPALGKKIIKLDNLPSINIPAASDSSCIVVISGKKYYISITEYTYSKDIDGKFRFKRLSTPIVSVVYL